jgi:hypothetical protein
MYCLYVDEICVESVEHMKSAGTLVKLVCRDWENPWSPEERLKPIHPPYHDRITEYHEEDVGLMYMPIHCYMNRYEGFNHWAAGWDNFYIRPPFTEGPDHGEHVVGFGRTK